MRLHVKFHRKNYGKLSLKAKGTSIWNDLTPDEAQKKNQNLILLLKEK